MAPQNSLPSPLMAHLKRLWIHGFLAGLAVVLIILAIGFFIWGWPTTDGPEGEEGPKPTISQPPAITTTPPAPAAKATPPPAAKAQTPAALKAELAAILVRLAEAHKKKDLAQLLSIYSASFPDLQLKAQEISRTWDTYDYPSLSFRIEELKSQDPENVLAKVTWEAETRNRTTQEIKNLTKTYLVRFTKDAGQWRIKGLDKTS